MTTNNTPTKKVRAPSLVAGNNYTMMLWGKAPTFTPVRFVEFRNAAGEIVAKSPKLNCMKDGDAYHFVDLTNNSKFTGVAVDQYLAHADSKARITFSEGAAPVAVAKPAKVSTRKSKAIAEPVAPVETAQERKNRLRREARARAKAAKPAESSEQAPQGEAEGENVTAQEPEVLDDAAAQQDAIDNEPGNEPAEGQDEHAEPTHAPEPSSDEQRAA